MLLSLSLLLLLLLWEYMADTCVVNWVSTSLIEHKFVLETNAEVNYTVKKIGITIIVIIIKKLKLKLYKWHSCHSPIKKE